MRSRSSLANETKRYWNARAEKHGGRPSATTNDVHLRRLEVATLTESLRALVLPPGARVVDIGCGDGYSTLQLARALPRVMFLGVDFSESMIETARAAAAATINDLPPNSIRFEVGDVLELGAAAGAEPFDVALTDRCLINLDSFEAQAHAIAEIAACVVPGGAYIAIENFVEGQENMNDARRRLGLEEIPIRWHNLFFTEPGFVDICSPYFEEIQFTDFSSSYYFATRIVYSGMCRLLGQEPDYDHPIHRLAPELPPTGRFSPIRKIELRRRPEGSVTDGLERER
jgi:ubiquinone/menaquinone biosynthesis C-methylase UbiE